MAPRSGVKTDQGAPDTPFAPVRPFSGQTAPPHRIQNGATVPTIPKHDEELVDKRSARRRAPSTTLPAGGYDGPRPDSPVVLSPAALELYVDAWRSPVAAAWIDADAILVAEWAALKAATFAKLAAGDDPQAAILGQVKAREDALGMSPKARASMRMRVVDDDVDVDDAGQDRADAWASNRGWQVAD